MSRPEDPTKCPHPMDALQVWMNDVACHDCGHTVRLAVDGANGGYLQAVGERHELLLDHIGPRTMRAAFRGTVASDLKPDPLYSELDPGIREIVRALRGAGWETSDSGDGVSKPQDERTFDVPHVVAISQREGAFVQDARMLAAALERLDGPGWCVLASFDTRDGIPCLIATKDGGGLEPPAQRVVTPDVQANPRETIHDFVGGPHLGAACEVCGASRNFHGDLQAKLKSTPDVQAQVDWEGSASV